LFERGSSLGSAWFASCAGSDLQCSSHSFFPSNSF
jgi:hypothetical protein